MGGKDLLSKSESDTNTQIRLGPNERTTLLGESSRRGEGERPPLNRTRQFRSVTRTSRRVEVSVIITGDGKMLI